jgi:hypothetical protein
MLHTLGKQPKEFIMQKLYETVLGERNRIYYFGLEVDRI